jgi:hypothetical protein
MDDVKVRICAGLKLNRKSLRCRECGDPAWVEWRCERRLAHYCQDCAALLGLAVPSWAVAQDLGVKRGTVSSWCRQGKISSYKDNAGRLMILKPYDKGAH